MLGPAFRALRGGARQCTPYTCSKALQRASTVPWEGGPPALSPAASRATQHVGQCLGQQNSLRHQHSYHKWQQQQHQHHQHGRGGTGVERWWGAGAAAAAAGAALGAASLAPAPAAAAGKDEPAGDGVEATDRKVLSLDLRRRIFFKYEKRIRDMSSLEKTYEYFATQTDASGAKVMGVRDVVRAVVPTYPASGANAERAGFLDGERGAAVGPHGIASEPRNSSFRALDNDGDGFISFAEFRLVVLLLSIPHADIPVVFSVIDVDDSGTIDALEFDEVISELEKRSGLQIRFHARPGKHDNTGAGDTELPTGNVVKALFGARGRGTLDLKRFKAFLVQLHADVSRLEFAHYDTGRMGYIRGLDFGNSIAAAADVKAVDEYLDRVRDMDPKLQSARISFADFSALAQLRRHLHRLAYALEFSARIGRPVGPEDFLKLSQRLAGVKLSPTVVAILFAVCGSSDDDGEQLDGQAFVQLMRERDRMPGRKSAIFADDGRSRPVTRLFTCFKACIVDPQDSGGHPEE